MKRWLKRLTLFLLMLLWMSPVQAGQRLDGPTALSRALEAQDWTALDNLLAKDCTYIHSFGRVDRREDFLRNILRFTAIDEWRYADVELRRYKGVVIATGNLFVTLTLSDGTKQTSQQRFTEVWVPERDGDRPASHQSTTFK